jgi:pimeloyl-ACP methyl ester carboxylesterase
MPEKLNVVLIHGGFVDGSGWEGVYRLLRKRGFNVSIVQNPTISLADDVAVTKRVIAAQPGPVVLVGHSYGGVVVTEAGTYPKVARLVYIAAFAPDAGESIQSLFQNSPPGAPVPPILPPQDGFLLLDRAKFVASFAADVNPDLGAFMADSQVPWGAGIRRSREPTRLEIKTQLVPCLPPNCLPNGFRRRQDDPAGRAAGHVQACGIQRCRDERNQPFGLRFAA